MEAQDSLTNYCDYHNINTGPRRLARRKRGACGRRCTVGQIERSDEFEITPVVSL